METLSPSDLYKAFAVATSRPVDTIRVGKAIVEQAHFEHPDIATHLSDGLSGTLS